MNLQFAANNAAMLANQEHSAYSAPNVNNTWLYFLRYFQTMQASSAEQKQRIYQLRHKVYCEELHYEPARVSCMEQDDFDHRSIHLAVNHIANDSLAGTVRIVTSECNSELLPIERYFANELHDTPFAPKNFNRLQVCEISRLAVPAEIRCTSLAQQGTGLVERDCNKLVAVSLYLTAQLLCLRSGRVHAYAMIEPALARALRRVGIYFIQIGKPIEFNGIRAPYYLDARTVSDALKPDYLQLLTMLEAQLFSKHSVRPQAELCYSQLQTHC